MVTTGTFTIPLMKRVGFLPRKRGRWKVSSSVNGMLTPPVIGAVAFLITEYVGIPYVEVVKTAIVPALISYIALIYIVHLESVKAGMRGLPRSTPPSPMGIMLIRSGIIVASSVVLCGGAFYVVEGLKFLFGDMSGAPILALLLAGYLILLRMAAKAPDMELEDINAEMARLPVFSEIYQSGLSYFIPIIVLIWFLIVERKSPGFSAFWASLFLLFILATQKPLKEAFRKTGDMRGSASRRHERRLRRFDRWRPEHDRPGLRHGRRGYYRRRRDPYGHWSSHGGIRRVSLRR